MAQRPYNRADRLANSIQEVVSDSLQYEASDPRLNAVVVTRVVVAPDLQNCKIYWNLLTPGDAAELAEVDAALTRARGWLKRQIAGQVHVRKLPEIKLYHDRGLEHARHMEELLRDLPGTSTGERSE